MFDSIARSEAFGRSQIVEKDRHYSQLKRKVSAKYFIGKYTVSAIGLNWIAAQDESVKVSFDLIPEDALKYLREKAFWVSGISNQDLLNEIQTALERAMREGKSYKEFAAEVRQSIDALGYNGAMPYRLQNICRTNIFSAYTIGQLSQIDQVKDRFPRWRYVAIMDERTRPLHRDLNDKIFRTGEGPMPPIDYGCRCTAQFIHIYDDSADLEIMPDDSLKKLLGDTQVVRFDNQGDFEKWRDENAAVMDERIKNTILSNL
jgi:SPP1 gp7 family putative phage head morphogenesis protein